MEMNECIEEFDARRQTVCHSRPMYSLCVLLTWQAGRWLSLAFGGEHSSYLCVHDWNPRFKIKWKVK